MALRLVTLVYSVHRIYKVDDENGTLNNYALQDKAADMDPDEAIDEMFFLEEYFEVDGQEV